MNTKQIYDTLLGLLPDGVKVMESEVTVDYDFEPDIERTSELGYNTSRYTGYMTLTVELVWYDPTKDQRRKQGV